MVTRQLSLYCLLGLAIKNKNCQNEMLQVSDAFFKDCRMLVKKVCSNSLVIWYINFVENKVFYLSICYLLYKTKWYHPICWMLLPSHPNTRTITNECIIPSLYGKAALELLHQQHSLHPLACFISKKVKLSIPTKDTLSTVP